MLLGVVAELGAVAEADLALVGLVDAGQDAQQRGLAGPRSAPQHQQPLAPLEVEGDVLEHRRPAVGAGQVDGVQREAARGRQVEADRHLPPDLRSGVSRSFIFSTRRSVTMARRAMSSLEWRYFSTKADSRLMSRSRTLRCLASERARTSRLQVLGPGALVGLDRGGERVEHQHGDVAVQQGQVVGDEQDAAGEVGQEPGQPALGVGVQVVGGLVQQQRGRLAEQHPGQLDPAPLATRQPRQRPVEPAGRDAEAGRDPAGLGLGPVAALVLEALLEAGEPLDGPVAGAASALWSIRRRASSRSWRARSRPRADSSRARPVEAVVGGDSWGSQASSPTRVTAGSRFEAARSLTSAAGSSCRPRWGRPGRRRRRARR